MLAITFGENFEDVRYTVRKDGYGVILHPSGKKIAVVKTPKGYFLPGGSVEANETLGRCLKREVLEEIGYEVKVISFIGRAKKNIPIQLR